MARADTVAFPLLMDQPITWWVVELRADYAQRFARDKLRFAKQPGALGCG